MNIQVRQSSPQWQGGFNQSNYFSATYQPENLPQTIKKLTGTHQEKAQALYQLSLNRESYPDLGILLWESPGTMASLLSEIVAVYPEIAAISSGTTYTPLNPEISKAICHTLTLFQSIASHKETRIPFIRANIPMYLFPFLHTINTSRECEYFKLTSLGIIGTLVKSELPEIINYLNQNGFVPLCLRILKFGKEMSKIVSAYILQKILYDLNGREYISEARDRIETILKVLNLVIADLAVNFNPRLSRNIVPAYRYLLKLPNIQTIMMEMPYDKLMKIKLADNCDQAFVDLFNQIMAIKGK